MILLKVIIYLLVFFPFLETSSDSPFKKGHVRGVGSFTFNLETLKPLRELANADIISDTSRTKWSSLNIDNIISSQLREQCPTSSSRLENVILKNYNAGYRKALETNNENWMRVKIDEVEEGIKSCIRELRRYYVKFSHEVVGPLHRVYNLNNPNRVYNKDKIIYMNVHFVNYLQQKTSIPEGSKLFALREILVGYKDWQEICITGEGGIDALMGLQEGQMVNDGGYGLTTADLYKSLSQFIKSGCSDRFRSVKTEMRRPLVTKFVSLPGECSVASNEENSKIMKFKEAVELRDGLGRELSLGKLDVMNYCQKELQEASNKCFCGKDFCDPESSSNLSRIHAGDKELCGESLDVDLNNCFKVSSDCKKSCNDRFQYFREKYRDYFFITDESNNIHFKYGTECKGVLQEINAKFKKSLLESPYSLKDELKKKDLSSAINLGVICEGPKESLISSYNDLQEKCGTEEEVAEKGQEGEKRQVATSNTNQGEIGSGAVRGKSIRKGPQEFQYEKARGGVRSVSGGSGGLVGGGIGTGIGSGTGIGEGSNPSLDTSSRASLSDGDYSSEEDKEEDLVYSGFSGRLVPLDDNVVEDNNPKKTYSKGVAGVFQFVSDKTKEGLSHIDKRIRDVLLSHKSLPLYKDGYKMMSEAQRNQARRGEGGLNEKFKDVVFAIYNRAFPNEEDFRKRWGLMRRGVDLQEVTFLMFYKLCNVYFKKPMHECALSSDDPEKYTRTLEGVVRRLNFLTERQLVTPEVKRKIKLERRRLRRL